MFHHDIVELTDILMYYVRGGCFPGVSKYIQLVLMLLVVVHDAKRLIGNKFHCMQVV